MSHSHIKDQAAHTSAQANLRKLEPTIALHGHGVKASVSKIDGRGHGFFFSTPDQGSYENFVASMSDALQARPDLQRIWNGTPRAFAVREMATL